MLLVVVLLVGYGVSWTTGGGGTVEEIVVTATRPTPRFDAGAAEVASARTPAETESSAGGDADSLGWSYTVVPSLLLRVEPTIGALARRQLPVDTPVEVLTGAAESDGYDWVRVRIEEGTEGWLIAEGVA